MTAANVPPPLESFESQRPLLFSIAYRMLGSAMEAEDILQEAYLRYQAVPPDGIRSPRAFLCTVVTRLCLNQLESARAKRETYIGSWLPEPVLTEAGEASEAAALHSLPLSPPQQAELRDSISLAFLVLLEQLTPVERAAFLLREVFDYDYAEIADILEKDEAACRQLLSRAKKHIAAGRPRFKPAPEKHRQILQQFMQTVTTGQVEDLMALLADDVVMWADGGGKVRGAATHPLHGRAAVAQFVLGSLRYLSPGYQAEVAEVNGQPAAILRAAGRAAIVIAVEADAVLIHEIRVIGNPDKLKAV